MKGVNVVNSPGIVIFPSVAYILYPPDAADRDEVAGRVYTLVSSDEARTMNSVDPAWRV